MFSDKLVSLWGANFGYEKESLVTKLITSFIHLFSLAYANGKVWIINKHQSRQAGAYLLVCHLKTFRHRRYCKP